MFILETETQKAMEKAVEAASLYLTSESLCLYSVSAYRHSRNFQLEDETLRR